MIVVPRSVAFGLDRIDPRLRQNSVQRIDASSPQGLEPIPDVRIADFHDFPVWMITPALMPSKARREADRGGHRR